MYGGKTSKIIEMKREVEENHKNNTLIINHSHDNRYSENNFIITHDDKKEVCIKTKELYPLINEELCEFTHVFIDEAQFFDDADLELFVKKCLFVLKQDIIVCGLISNCNLGEFKGVTNIMRYADDIIFLKGRCNFCNTKNASCTYVEGVSSFNDGDPVNMNRLTSYNFKPSCKRCWIKNVEMNKN
jgi:thymidine kinase